MKFDARNDPVHIVNSANDRKDRAFAKKLQAELAGIDSESD